MPEKATVVKAGNGGMIQLRALTVTDLYFYEEY